MLRRDLLLASAAVLVVGLTAGDAWAQKLKPFIVDNTVYSAAEFKALTKDRQKELKAIQKIETKAYKLIFSAATKAAKSGNESGFAKITQAQYESLISDPTVGLFEDDNTMDVSAGNRTGDDPVAYAGLDRFIGGSNNGIKFSLTKYLPALRDANGDAIAAEAITSVSAGKKGAKTSAVNYDSLSGDVSVTLKPLKGNKQYGRNQFVNLNVNIANVGPVQLTYWLSESKPETKYEFESATDIAQNGSFSVNVNDFRVNQETDVFDSGILAGRFVGAGTTTVNGVSGSSVQGSTTEPFVAILGLMTNGKLIRSSFGSYTDSSPNS